VLSCMTMKSSPLERFHDSWRGGKRQCSKLEKPRADLPLAKSVIGEHSSEESVQSPRELTKYCIARFSVWLLSILDYFTFRKAVGVRNDSSRR
jgi:hypothetical protein